jgi:hypothetical protein
MRDEEKYFLLIGLLVSLFIAFFIAQHNKSQGYSFGKTYFFASVSLFGLVCVFWQWYWK